ncbi:DUF982 domain-containing protein [Rhizobium sp. S163]|uniref:DUF982 domain-containing protein n=1 Tax=Rhizobium sp. S163 TaxID=3055039 RepID=UPI0025AA0534|nr:DUF982 domain-containing protein [Rhizobium sp. S163]MDM9645880.1 DUF982 domain-containing protein [Rhizobium sp. S163]
MDDPCFGRLPSYRRRLHGHQFTREALKMLFTAWPVAEGKAYFSALEVCDGVAIGKASPEDARLAFIAAADEAKVPYDVVPAAPVPL